MKTPYLSHTIFLSVLLVAPTSRLVVNACTNFIVTPGASDDGSMILAYNSDDHNNFGMLYHYPAANTTASRGGEKETRMHKIWDWETG